MRHAIAAVLLAAATGLTTQLIQTAPPSNVVNLAGVSPLEGSSLAVLRADARLGISAPVCGGTQHLTSTNGTGLVCSADTFSGLVADSPLTGVGTAGSHLGIQTATSLQPGALTSVDWSTFNGKAAVGSCGANQFGTATTTGGLTCAQPSFGNLSGSVAASQMPALTGDVTTSAGNVATTLASVNSAGTYTKVATDVKGRVTAGAIATLASADFANQGTAGTVLHGNAAGNPSFGAVQLTEVASAAVDKVVLGNATPSWTAAAVPSCSTASSALTYDTTAHTFGCNTLGSGITFQTVAATAGSPAPSGGVGIASLTAGTTGTYLVIVSLYVNTIGFVNGDNTAAMHVQKAGVNISGSNLPYGSDNHGEFYTGTQFTVSVTSGQVIRIINDAPDGLQIDGGFMTMLKLN